MCGGGLLHREIGNALEEMDDAEELTEELADHFAAAEEQNKAVKYMRLSGKKALKKTRLSPGIEMRFEAVRDWTMNDDFESPEDAIDFLCDYADALRNCGQYNSALELLDEAKALLPDNRKDLKASILNRDRWYLQLKSAWRNCRRIYAGGIATVIRELG